MTEPAVGASVWASGSQVCTGTTGTLIAKANRKAPYSQYSRCPGMLVALSASRAKV